jgi:dienelactone hydrolase
MRPRLLSLIIAIFAAATPARADLPYAGSSVTVASTTNGQPQDLPATLLKPEGAGPFPAVVIMHDCSGLGARSSGSPGRWGSILAGQGYVVLIPDSFAPRGFPDGVCLVTTAGPTLRTTLPIQRAVDAFAAGDYLRHLAYVDGAHIGVMGGSHGGSTTLASMVDAINPLAPPGIAQGASFAAGIALYPGCGATYGNWSVDRQFRDHGPVTSYVGTYKPVAPLLILVGEKDDWTPAEHCAKLAATAQAAGFPVSTKIYPGAYHSFDSDRPPRYVAERRNANMPEGRGATTGGDPIAWKDAIVQVKACFAQNLKNDKAER